MGSTRHSNLMLFSVPYYTLIKYKKTYQTILSLEAHISIQQYRGSFILILLF